VSAATGEELDGAAVAELARETGSVEGATQAGLAMAAHYPKQRNWVNAIAASAFRQLLNLGLATTNRTPELALRR